MRFMTWRSSSTHIQPVNARYTYYSRCIVFISQVCVKFTQISNYEIANNNMISLES